MLEFSRLFDPEVVGSNTSLGNTMYDLPERVRVRRQRHKLPSEGVAHLRWLSLVGFWLIPDGVSLTTKICFNCLPGEFHRHSPLLVLFLLKNLYWLAGTPWTLPMSRPPKKCPENTRWMFYLNIVCHAHLSFLVFVFGPAWLLSCLPWFFSKMDEPPFLSASGSRAIS